MGHKWMIDVLEDLAAFAQQNDLPVIAEKLQETSAFAMEEFAETSEGASAVAYKDGAESRRLPRQSRAC